MRTSVAIVLALLVSRACPAHASDVLRASDRPFRLDTGEMAVDRAAPAPPVLGCTLIWRGWGSDGVEASKFAASQKGFVQFVVEGASDDRTKPDELGYRFELVAGTLPDGLSIADDAVLAGAAGDLYLKWDDGATWQQDAFCFCVRVVAVDRAGNRSKPSNAVLVCHDGDMTYTRQQARLIYARAAANAAESAAAAQLALPDDAPQAPEKEPAGKPAAITDVYKDATIGALEKIKNVRIDRVEYRSRRLAIESYDLSQFTVRESGRALTADEVTQLRQLLLRPQSYTTDVWGGTFDTGYAFFSDDLDRPFYIVVNQASFQIGIGDSESRDSGNLSREAATILLGFCDGLFRLGAK